MAKKAKGQKSQKKRGRSQKWSRANIANYVLGGIVAVSMLIGSVFMFGGTSPSASAPAPTTMNAVTPTPTSSVQGISLTPTPGPTQAP